jgi:formyltetrahydrofolate hydrolase
MIVMIEKKEPIDTISVATEAKELTMFVIKGGGVLIDTMFVVKEIVKTGTLIEMMKEEEQLSNMIIVIMKEKNIYMMIVMIKEGELINTMVVVIGEGEDLKLTARIVSHPFKEVARRKVTRRKLMGAKVIILGSICSTLSGEIGTVKMLVSVTDIHHSVPAQRQQNPTHPAPIHIIPMLACRPQPS